MSVDNRLRYLWEPKLGKVEPPSQQAPPSVASQGHTQGGSETSYQAAAPSVDIGHPVRSVAPTEKAEARAQRTERRDERRLWVEMAALVLGFFGLIGLLMTLNEARWATEAALQSLVTARRQLELSERPWVTAAVTLTCPFEMNHLLEFEVSLKNVGHSVATDISVKAEVMLYPHPDFTLPFKGPTEIDERRERLCGDIARLVTQPGMGKLVLFPDEQGVIKIETGIFHEVGEGRTLRDLSSSSMLVEPMLIGCVTYLSTFTTRRHVTGFTYFISSIHHPEGYLYVDEITPIQDIRLKPYPYGGETYID